MTTARKPAHLVPIDDETPFHPIITQDADHPHPAWFYDDAVLARLDLISRLDLQGHTPLEIAEQLKLTVVTVREDLVRLAHLRLASVESKDVIEMRQRSIGVFQQVQREAWRRLLTVPKGSRVGADLLNQVSAAEREIVRLQGTLQEVAKKESFDHNVHIQIVDAIAERVAQVTPTRATLSLPGHVDAPGSGGTEVPLAAVGTAEPIAAEWRVVDVDDSGGTGVRQDPDGSGVRARPGGEQ